MIDIDFVSIHNHHRHCSSVFFCYSTSDHNLLSISAKMRYKDVDVLIDEQPSVIYRIILSSILIIMIVNNNKQHQHRLIDNFKY
ncbi:hypothetical protein DERF_002950 [Dermatophagoides farinae]|uniref:Uncharacterized protein n=1 Tax=Dermatophagoides farinae TaxID=6954 RepID=A0A922IEM7_DERFA|nr:hypothetical protein DERF_002950 [Dermatophagoides farinae]